MFGTVFNGLSDGFRGVHSLHDGLMLTAVIVSAEQGSLEISDAYMSLENDVLSPSPYA